MAQQTRPPIVTFMGHVDHGKTSLLDYIRKTRVQAGEFGGITQHIGAYQAQYKGETITFIDTPGHSAFSKMRSRGASVTDIVVLVVAADDGVMPQTIESIKHIKQAEVPFIVAINKMDVQGASADMVKAQLTEQEVYIAGYGGDVEAVEVSAQTGDGIDNLLETIVTMGELLELKADPEGELKGVVIESEKSKTMGSVGTVLVKNGTLSLKDQIYAGDVACQVRTMTDATGQRLRNIEPSQAAQITGFDEVPAVGSVVSVLSAQVEEEQGNERPSLSDLLAQLEEEPKVRLVLKADTRGTLEAIEQNIPEENVEFIGSGVGDVNENDIMLAETTNARVIAFQVKVPGAMKKLASRQGIEVAHYKIIYKLLEDVQGWILKLLEPTIDEQQLARANVLKLFDIRGQQILGCSVQEGTLREGQDIHWRRGEKVMGDSKITSLKQGKADVQSVEAGQECGVILADELKVKAGDIIEAFTVSEN